MSGQDMRKLMEELRPDGENEIWGETKHEDLTERQAWNRIMKIVGDAGDQGLLEDVGRKKVGGRIVHEFVISEHWFHIIKAED